MFTRATGLLPHICANTWFKILCVNILYIQNIKTFNNNNKRLHIDWNNDLCCTLTTKGTKYPSIWLWIEFSRVFHIYSCRSLNKNACFTFHLLSLGRHFNTLNGRTMFIRCRQKSRMNSPAKLRKQMRYTLWVLSFLFLLPVIILTSNFLTQNSPLF